MNKHMNIFIPYEKNNEHHEDHLTRSFLLLLKYSPSIFYMFYNYVTEQYNDNEVNLDNLYESELNYTLTTQIGCEKAIDYACNNILSILITDEKLELKSEVHCSERNAIYDGIISINDNWTFIIENKPYSENVWEEQLSPGEKLSEHINSNNLKLIQKPVVLTWREIFKRLSNLKCSALEKLLIDDFLDFVFNNYPKIFPYEKFKQCKKDTHLVNLRIEKLLKTIINQQNEQAVDYHKNWAYKIKYSTNFINQIDYRPVFENNSISIYFCFGLNLGKSRNFFQKIDANKLSNLKDYDKNFNIRITDSYGKTVYSINCKKGDNYEKEFINYWKKHIKEIGQAQTSDIIDRIEKDYLNFEFIDKFDIEDLKEKIGNRKKLRITPVLDMEYCINFETIYSLEANNQLEQEFVDKTIEGLKLVDDDKDFIEMLNPNYK